jgi:hypothetical protein
MLWTTPICGAHGNTENASQRGTQGRVYEVCSGSVKAYGVPIQPTSSRKVNFATEEASLAGHGT